MAAAHPVGGASEEGVSDTSSRLQGLQRENGRLQEQLRSSEELNSSLRSELDLHRSIMAQTSSSQKEQDDRKEGLRSQAYARNLDGEVSTQKSPVDQHLNSGNLQRSYINWCFYTVFETNAYNTNKLNRKCGLFNTILSDLLGEHLQEIRALRLRLEESIRTNDRLREQLEKKLAEVEKDSGTQEFGFCSWYNLQVVVLLFVNRIYFLCVCSAATNIFIRGEEQGQLANEIRILWGQNQALKEQLSMGSKGQTHAWIISNKLLQLNLYKVLNVNPHFWNSLQTSRKRMRS